MVLRKKSQKIFLVGFFRDGFRVRNCRSMKIQEIETLILVDGREIETDGEFVRLVFSIFGSSMISLT